MSYLNRVWMAASVAVVQGHTDQGPGAGGRSLRRGKDGLLPAFAGPGIGWAVVGGGGGKGGSGEDGRSQADDSLRKVMYLSCWGPS